MNTLFSIVVRLALIAIFVAITAFIVTNFENIHDIQINIFGFIATLKADHIEAIGIVFCFFAFFITLFALIDCFIVVILENRRAKNEAKYLEYRNRTRSYR